MKNNKQKTDQGFIKNLSKINQVKIDSGLATLNKKRSIPIDYHVEVPKKYRNYLNRILLIGSPNVGKSTFFNHLTNAVAGVSNIDRMTVATNWGMLHNTKDWLMVDLPGLYNLSHPIEEELVVADMLIKGEWKNITNIIGAPCIERDLYLTLQVAETGKLANIIVNMIDDVNVSTINFKKISKAFDNTPLYHIQASKFNKRKHINLINERYCRDNVLKYPKKIENAITLLSKFLPIMNVSKRFIALMILEKNQYVLHHFEQHYQEEYQKILKFYQNQYQEEFSVLIRNHRLAFIHHLIETSIHETTRKAYLKSNLVKQHKVDHVLLNKWIGIPLFILLVILIYYISFGPYMGGSLQSLLCDKFLNGIVADKWLHALFYDVFHSGVWFSQFMIDGLFKGLFTVISFIPPIFILFTLINLINQVGLISRISVLLDQTFEKFGLSGRAIVNLMTGFGCNVPAIMMARSSNSKKERVVSILITPFISCSARAIVFNYVCVAMFGTAFGWLGVIVLLIFSGLIALMLGLIFSQTMFRKQKSFFLIEMTNWRKPDFRVIFKNVWLELKDFIKKAASIIIIVNLLLWMFLHLGPNGTITDENKIGSSFIGYLGKYVNYIFYPMGGNLSHGWVGNENGWKMTTSLIAAFPAKEIAITNLSFLFPNETLSSFLSAQIPIGISYLVILAFYLPCAATAVMVKKEGGWKNLGIHLLSSISISYVLGLIFYWFSYLCIYA